MTSPQRSERRRGEALVAPKLGVIIVDAPRGAEVVTLNTGMQVMQLSALIEYHRQAMRDYWGSEHWAELEKQLTQTGKDTRGVEKEIAGLDQTLAQMMAQQAGIAVNAGTIKELRHVDKKRSYRMATGRKNG